MPVGMDVQPPLFSICAANFLPPHIRSRAHSLDDAMPKRAESKSESARKTEKGALPARPPACPPARRDDGIFRAVESAGRGRAAPFRSVFRCCQSVRQPVSRSVGRWVGQSAGCRSVGGSISRSGGKPVSPPLTPTVRKSAVLLAGSTDPQPSSTCSCRMEKERSNGWPSARCEMVGPPRSYFLVVPRCFSSCSHCPAILSGGWYTTSWLLESTHILAGHAQSKQPARGGGGGRANKSQHPQPKPSQFAVRALYELCSPVDLHVEGKKHVETTAHHSGF